MDTVSPEVRSRTMRAVKGKNTSLELKFRQALWDAGARGWRLHKKSLPGNPDIVFIMSRVVVFLDSCFWHGCPRHLRMPKSNQDYWKTKISRNVERDAVTNLAYRELGWTLIRFWEHDLKENLEGCVKKVRTAARR